MLKLERHICGALANNAYLWYDTDSKEGMLVDPAMGSEYLADNIRSLELSLKYLINTHGHFDHTFNNRFFKDAFPEATFLIHKGDEHMLKAQTEMASMFGFDAESSPPPDAYIDESTNILLGQFAFVVLEVPGHSPGGIALHFGSDVLVGDALFEGSIGRTDLPGGDHTQLIGAIRQKLFTLPDETIVYPGHGATTTIGKEKATNPFFQ